MVVCAAACDCGVTIGCAVCFRLFAGYVLVVLVGWFFMAWFCYV